MIDQSRPGVDNGRVNSYEHSVDLACSPGTAWAYTTDLARTPEWRTTITSIEPPTNLSVGEEFSGTTKLLGRTWTWGLRIVAVVHERQFAYKVVEGVATPTVEYRIEPTPTGCRFTMSGWIDEMNTIARVLKPFALRALNRETVRHLDNLRRVLASANDGGHK